MSPEKLYPIITNIYICHTFDWNKTFGHEQNYLKYCREDVLSVAYPVVRILAVALEHWASPKFQQRYRLVRPCSQCSSRTPTSLRRPFPGQMSKVHTVTKHPVLLADTKLQSPVCAEQPAGPALVLKSPLEHTTLIRINC